MRNVEVGSVRFIDIEDNDTGEGLGGINYIETCLEMYKLGAKEWAEVIDTQ